jgi:hypothetical protein
LKKIKVLNPLYVFNLNFYRSFKFDIGSEFDSSSALVATISFIAILDLQLVIAFQSRRSEFLGEYLQLFS